MSKLKEVWNQAVKFSLGKGKLDAKERDRKRRLEVKDPTKGAPDLQEHKRQVRTLERQGMENMAEKRRRSKEGNAAAADKAARFLADGDEDLELESGADDEFVPEVELFPETEPGPAAST
ncbi:Protein purity of essence [Dissostichus eleginoides]|uniref:Protein purity of essence n=1 Tax=Dissostichus eleginoides TaxID=100907 RepID=A0AAD9CPJ0_DISEL|nr:Protein purity of essence [Dissostichus eleginoides]